MITTKQIAGIYTEKLATEKAIQLVKSTFEQEFISRINLSKVSAPMVVLDGEGTNDDLNGIERPVGFPVKFLDDKRAEVVQSLAKWKRLRLAEYDLPPGHGIITDMKALRPDEDLSPIHSIYVDQWDWELVMRPEEKSLAFLKLRVEQIYDAILATEKIVTEDNPLLTPILPEKITFLHTEDLLKKYPDLSPKQRENEAAREFGAIFLIGIGAVLSNGLPHDGRAPDYDDWSTPTPAGTTGLNGDIILWNPVLEQAFEISSMGIRVDAAALDKQLSIRQADGRRKLFYHQQLLEGKLPQTIGGGIGQSRLCMFLLRKRHIGEVQVGIWPESLRKECRLKGIDLL